MFIHCWPSHDGTISINCGDKNIKVHEGQISTNCPRKRELGGGYKALIKSLVNKFSYNKQYIFIDSTNASNPDTVFSQTLISDTNFILIDSILKTPSS